MPAERPPSARRTARMAAVLAVLIGGVLGADLAALQRKPEWDARPPPAEAPPPARRLPRPTGDFRSEPAAAGQIRVWPRSAPVEPGRPYRFTVGHCGLEHLVDFDGSFWDLAAADGLGRPPSFFVSADRGTMTLVARGRAVYRSSHGEEVRLVRHRGPKTVYPCR